MSKKNRPATSVSRKPALKFKSASVPAQPEAVVNATPEVVDAPAPVVAESSQEVSSTSVSGDTSMINLTYRATKKNVVLYSINEGLKGSVRFLTSQFTGTPPTSLVVNGDFAQPVVKAPRVKLTPEERKAARAAAPKLTLEQKIAKREAALVAMKAKAAKVAAQASA